MSFVYLTPCINFYFFSSTKQKEFLSYLLYIHEKKNHLILFHVPTVIILKGIFRLEINTIFFKKLMFQRLTRLINGSQQMLRWSINERQGMFFFCIYSMHSATSFLEQRKLVHSSIVKGCFFILFGKLRSVKKLEN